jgi:PadR family transcriptional regulator PadR
MPPPTDLLQGTLDLLILQTVAPEPLHRWRIAQRLSAAIALVLTKTAEASS